MKKLLAVILAVVMVVSCFAVFPAAEGETVYKDGVIKFVVRNEQAYVVGVDGFAGGSLNIPAKVCADSNHIYTSSVAATLNGLDDDDNDVDDPFGTNNIYVVGIEANAFSACASTLTSLSLSRYITSINIDALRIEALESISVNDANTVYSTSEGTLYSADGTTLYFHPEASTDGTILDTVTSISNSAFRYSDRMTSVTIPAGLTAIPEYCFDHCISLEEVIIPADSALTDIATYAFGNDTALTSVSFGTEIENIAQFAFYNCTALTALNIPESEKSVTVGAAAFLGAPLENLTLYSNISSVGNRAFGYYYDAQYTIQKREGFTITGYKYNSDRATNTNVYKYASNSSFNFIPLDPLYVVNYNCNNLTDRTYTMKLYKNGTFKYDNNSASGTFTFTDIEEGSYSTYITTRFGVLVRVNNDVVTSGGTEEYVYNDNSLYIPIGDVDGDGVIGINDVSLILISSNYGSNASSYDITGDGVVDVKDVSTILLSHNYSAQSDIIE